MKIIQTNTINEQIKVQILELWNKEYPKQLTYHDLPLFENYLNGLNHLKHFLLLGDLNEVLGWGLTFERHHERWFAIIISEHMNGKGFGQKLLEEIKKTETILNGWVIDHNHDMKNDGKQYLSPLGFYEKCGFKILKNERLELDISSAVKIQWVRKV